MQTRTNLDRVRARGISGCGSARMWSSQLEALAMLARYAAPLAGAFLELGVFQGGSAVTIQEQLPEGKQLFLCDTFEGMPDEVLVTDEDRRNWTGAHRATSLDAVRKLLSDRFGGMPDSVRFVPGVFPNSLSAVGAPRQVAFAHFDGDVYTSASAFLEFTWRRLNPEGCLLFHDYRSPKCPGVAQALSEFLSAHSEAVFLSLPQFQAVVGRPGFAARLCARLAGEDHHLSELSPWRPGQQAGPGVSVNGRPHRQTGA